MTIAYQHAFAAAQLAYDHATPREPEEGCTCSEPTWEERDSTHCLNCGKRLPEWQELEEQE